MAAPDRLQSIHLSGGAAGSNQLEEALQARLGLPVHQLDPMRNISYSLSSDAGKLVERTQARDDTGHRIGSTQFPRPMIEINLLRPRIKPPGWQSPLEPRGWSAFISRRELVLAIVLLALGFSILRVGFGLFESETNRDGRASLQRAAYIRRCQRTFLTDTQSDTESLAEDLISGGGRRNRR